MAPTKHVKQEPHSHHRHSLQQRSHETHPKVIFMIFLRILLRILKSESNELHCNCRHIVAACIHKSRQSDPAFLPLLPALYRQLKTAVGQDYWRRAQRVLVVHMARRHAKHASAAARPTAVASSSKPASTPPPPSQYPTTSVR